MSIDAWMQHPTVRFSGHEAFDSLRRWTGQQPLTQELVTYTKTCIAGNARRVFDLDR